MKEGALQNKMRFSIQAVEKLSRLFRNHRGKIQDARTGAWHEFGMAPGASDLIGWHSVVITPAMVGRRVAIFTAVEVKSSEGATRINDKRTRQQKRYLEVVRDAGGIGLMAWEVEQVEDAVRRSTELPGIET